MSEFNPTKTDLLTIDTIILGIKDKKRELVGRKISLQNSLSLIKEKMKSVPYKSKEFNKSKNTCENIKQHLGGIEIKIKALNDELSFKNALRLEVEHHIKNKPQPASEEARKILSAIDQLKAKYVAFAKDRTRVASLRVMANEFITELETITKTK